VERKRNIEESGSSFTHTNQPSSSWPDWRAEVATMKRAGADATDETGATDRSSPEP